MEHKPEHAIFIVGDTTIRIRTKVLGDLLWQNAPAVLTQPASPERKNADWVDLLPRPILRTILHRIIRGLWNDPTLTIDRHEDLLSYSVRLLISIVLTGVTAHQWSLVLEHEQIDPNQRTYDICGITTGPEESTPAPAGAAPTPDQASAPSD